MAGSLEKVHQAWAAISNDPSYKAMSVEDQQQTQDIFKAKVPDGDAVINQIQGPNRSFFDNTIQLAKESLFAAKDAVQMSDDVATGNIDGNTPAIIAKGHRRAQAQYKPPELQRMEDFLRGVSKRWDESQGIVESWDSTVKDLGRAAVEVVTNPKGVVYLGASSAGHSVPPIAGTIAGAASGMAATGPLPMPHLKAAGALVGGIYGGFTAESGAYLQQAVVEELQKNNLPVTEENVAVLLANEEFTKEAISGSRGKGLGTPIVDSFLGLGIGKMATTPIRTARKKALMELGENAAPDLINKRTLELMSERTVTQRAGTGVKAYTAGIASEPISEAAGQLAAGDELDMGELFGEAIGAIGMSTVSTPVDIAAFGTETPVVKDKIDKVKTKLSEKLAPKTEERKQAEALNKTRSSVDYKTKIEEAVKTQDISAYTDPKNEKYDPVLAVDSLKAINLDAATTPEAKIDNLAKAVQVQQDYQDQQIMLGRRVIALEEKKAAGTLTTEEKQELRDLPIVDKKMNETLAALDITLNSMHQTKLSPEDLQTRLQTLGKSTDTAEIDTAVKEIFASTGAAGVNSFGSSLAAIQTNPATSPATKAFLRDVEVFNKSRKKMEDAASKDPDTVHDNIISGRVGEYNGINTYQKNISELIAAGNIPRAKKEFETLTKFASSHRMKADILRKLQNEALGTYTLTPADKANLEILNKRKVSPYKVSNPKSEKWLNMISQVEREADLIEQGVKVASGLFTLNGKPAPEFNTNVKNNVKTSVDLTKINVKVQGSVDGKTKTFESTAQQALDDIDEEIRLYKEILNCVKGNK